MAADVLDALRRDIASFAFLPGERLAEEPLSERYGVSRTPVREALQRLEAEGLVEVVGSRRVVRKLDVAELEDIYRVRAELEQLAVRQACERAGDDAIAALAASWDSAEEYYESDVRFHAGVAALSANAYLAADLERIDGRIAIVRMVDFSSEERVTVTRSEHQAILAAIARRDADAAAGLMTAHIGAAMSNVRTAIVGALQRIYL